MPLVRKIALFDATLALWRIDEDARTLSGLCTAAEAARAFARYTGEARRREWLAWHALLHEVEPSAEAYYERSGAPALRGARFIGVSHTKGYAALMLGDRPCAVDIEPEGRCFAKAAPRFLSDAERGLPMIHGERALGLVWCAKEALYKWYGQPGVDFLRDIRILRIDPEHRTLTGRIGGRTLTLHDHSADGLLVVGCTGVRDAAPNGEIL